MFGLRASPDTSDEAREHQRKEADAVLSCWQKVQAMKSKGNDAQRIMNCVASATSYPMRACSDWVMDHSTSADTRLIPTDDSDFVGTDETVLQHNKRLYDEGHEGVQEIVDLVVSAANTAVEHQDETVVDKQFTPPSGDKRAYLSLDPSCWPEDPEDLQSAPEGEWVCSEDNEPFGGRNSLADDQAKLKKLLTDVYRMGLAYYFTGDENYAYRVSTKVRKFFIDPETGMLPHLLYARYMPDGEHSTGDASGTMDMVNIYLLLDALAMIRGCEAWRLADEKAFRIWMTEYLKFLHSLHMESQRCAAFSRGTYFDIHIVSVMLYLKKKKEARRHIQTLAKERMRILIKGAMLPNELIKQAGYQNVNVELEALARLALQAEKVGVNLWDYQAADYNSVLDAWDWMGEHWCDRGVNQWPVPQPEERKLAHVRGATWMGAVYNRVRKDGAYTQRALFYAKLFQQFREGHDPHDEMKWDLVLMNQLPTVQLDDCFVTLCPDSRVSDDDHPSFNATCASLNGTHSDIPHWSALPPYTAAAERPPAQFEERPFEDPASLTKQQIRQQVVHADVARISAVPVDTSGGRDGTLGCAQGEAGACMQSMAPMAMFLGVLLAVLAWAVIRRRIALASGSMGLGRNPAKSAPPGAHSAGEAAPAHASVAHLSLAPGSSSSSPRVRGLGDVVHHRKSQPGETFGPSS